MTLCAVALLSTITASSAFAAQAHVFRSSFGSAGSGAGQLAVNAPSSRPSGVAVNDTSGDVYVADQLNRRVDQFSSAGAFIRAWGWGVKDGAFELQACTEATGCRAGLSGTSPGEFEVPSLVAVDNSGGVSEGDVYVGDRGADNVVSKFGPEGELLGLWGSGGQLNGSTATDGPFETLAGIAVDSAGNLDVFAANGFLFRFAQDGSFISDFMAPGGVFPTGLAVNPSGDFFKVGVRGNAEEFGPGGAELGGVSAAGATLDETIDNTGLAVDSSNGRLYAAAEFFYGHPGDPEPQVDEYAFNGSGEVVEPTGTCPVAPGSGCTPTGSFGLGEIGGTAGVAVDSSSHAVYAVDSEKQRVDVFAAIIVPDVHSEAPSEVKAYSAIFNGTVNPAGVGAATCRFAWGTTKALGETPVPCQPEAVPDGSTPVAVHANLGQLQPGTTYFYRLQATNSQGTNPGQPSEDQQFTTPGPGMHSESASDVSGDAATLEGAISPHGVPTSYRFEYDTAPYGERGPPHGTRVPEPDQGIGSGEGDVTLHPQRIAGLSQNTVYHYRVTAVQEGEEFPGPDQTFRTQGSGGELILPDNRAWELVSPPDKHGGVIQSIPVEKGGAVQAAADGRAASYLANAPTESSPAGDAGLVQVLSVRGPSGWGSRDIANPHTRATGAGLEAPEYRLFSEDLSSGIVQPWGLFEPRLSDEASEQTPFLRALGSCTSSCYRPLVTAKPGFANALPGFGEEPECEEDGIKEFVEVICGPRFVGASNDLHHVALISPVPLSAGAGREQLYEWSDGSLSLVSVLPANGKGEELPAPEGTARFGHGLGLEGDQQSGSPRRAISRDGARVFWETRETVALYVRDGTHHQTLQLDRAETACEEAGECESGGGRFQVASADGSSVLFSDAHRLTKDAGKAGFSDLYECRIVLEGSGKLGCGPTGPTDLTPATGGEGAHVLNSVLGASEDDQSVYFVAEGVLSTNHTALGEVASAGKPNLYVRRGGVTSLIATLAQGDDMNWTIQTERQPARVSASGRWLMFMSERPLTGYDNRDVLSDKPDAEVYEYDAQTGRLSCASCNPSGARPHGVEFGRLGIESEELVRAVQWEGSGWVAALTPGSPAFRILESAYQTRSLSDTGRLFFDALDPLVPQDVNGNWDVYQREPEGVGNCAPGAAGFEAGSGSCLGLISSGASAQESAFLDASQSGGDVFFLTSATLTNRDFDAERDVYDAHECPSSSPCLPEAPESPPPCSTEASCRPAPTPQPQIFGAPASSTLSGLGNQTPSPPGKAKPPTRHELLVKALAACHKRYPRSKTRRGRCERQARNRYRTTSAKHSTNRRRLR